MKLIASGFWLIVACTLFLLPAAGCMQDDRAEVETLEAELEILQKQVASLEAEIVNFEQKGFLEERYEELLHELFSADELTDLAEQRGMSYRLVVNQEAVTEQLIYVDTGELNIEVSEAIVMFDDRISLLPNRILQPVMLIDLSEHLIVLESNTDYFDSPAEGGYAWGYGLFFEDAKRGSRVRLEISETLRLRLGVDFNRFTVIVN